MSTSATALPLYQRLLGDAWNALPAPVRQLHELPYAGRALIADGTASVERGSGMLARLVAATFGFPSAGREIPVTVEFEASGAVEHWRRTFAGRSFASTQEAGQGHIAQLLCERFGPVAIGIALVPDADRLRFEVRRWSLFGVPLPLALAPRGNSYEHAEGGRFCFHIEIGHGLTGLIVAYRGWLVPRGFGAGELQAAVPAQVPGTLVPAGPAA
jgi:hypothetical protein